MSSEDMQNFKINYKVQGKNPQEIEKLIQKAVDEVVGHAKINPRNVKILPPRNQAKWELTVETDPKSSVHKGPVEVHFCGVEGDDDPDILEESTDGNKAPFKPGQKATFSVPVDKSIGDIFKVRFGFPKRVEKGEWKMKSFKLFHPGNKDTFETECNLTLKKSPSDDPWQEVFVVWPDYPMLPLINYEVKVHTSAKSGSMNCGGDVVIYGDFGNSGRRSLKNKEKDSKFQKGNVDTFTLPIVKMGQIRKMRVINDLSKNKTEWLIEKVVVSGDAKEWVFPCNRYFDPNKGDKKFDRILRPNQEPEDPPLPPDPVPAPVPEPEKVKEKPKEEPPKEEPKEEPPKEEPKEEPKPKKEEDKKEINPHLWMIWWENQKTQTSKQSIPFLFTVIGDNGSTADLNIEMDLRPGISDKRRVRFDPQKVGDIQKVRFRFHDKIQASLKGLKWEISKLHLKHLASEDVHTFEFENPIIYKEGDSTVEVGPKGVPISIYEVELHTGDRDLLFEPDVVAKVLVRGVEGDTGQRTAVNAKTDGKLNLKKGGVLKFELEGVDIGEIKSVSFSHNKPDRVTAEFVEKIVVRPKHDKSAEYVVKFVKPKPEVPKTEWKLWWENHRSQKPSQATAVAFTIVGDKGSTVPANFKVDLKPGQTDDRLTIHADPDEIGDVDRVKITFGEEASKRPKWEILKLSLHHQKSGILYVFEFNVEAEQELPSVYEVEFHTANRTALFMKNVVVKVDVRGSQGDTGQCVAVNGPLKIKKGGVFKFEIESIDIGEIKGVSFVHNKPGKVTADFVQKIVVRPTHNKQDEYVMEFDIIKNAPGNLWHLWWENRDDQVHYEKLEISFIVVGENGSTDSFPFDAIELKPKVAPKLDLMFDPQDTGPIEKVRIKFAESVKNETKWEIAKLYLWRPSTGEIHEFEFEKAAVRLAGTDAVAEASNKGVPITVHSVIMYTGDRVEMFGENVVAKVILRGALGDTGKRTAYISGDPSFPKLQNGGSFQCEVEGVDIGEVKSIQFIHNKPDKKVSDFLTKIVVKPLHRPDVQYQFDFPKTEDPSIEVHQMEPMLNADPREWMMSWTNFKTQPKDKLQISLILFGEKGETAPYFVDIELAPGDSREYQLIINEEIGELTKLRFGHGPKTSGNHPWKVDEVRMKHSHSGILHIFKIGRPEVTPTLPPKYRVEVYSRKSATEIAPNAEIFLAMKGQKMNSDRNWLSSSLNNTVPFKSGQVDIFELNPAEDIGDVKEISFGGRDEKVVTALKAKVARVVVVPLHWKTRKEFAFDFGNSSVVPPAIPNEKYQAVIRVRTGNCPNSKEVGLLAIVMCGRHKTSEIIKLQQEPGFEPNQTHTFKTEIEDIQEFFKIRLGFMDWSARPTLFIEEVNIEILNGPIYQCAVSEWIWAGPWRDSTREFLVKNQKLNRHVFKYQLAVWTGSIGADNGIEYEVFAELIGSRGDTGMRRLAHSKSRVLQFLPNQFDLFDIEAIDIGNVKKLKLNFHCSVVEAKWQVSKIIFQAHPLGGEEFIFEVNKVMDTKSNKSLECPITVRNNGQPFKIADKNDYLLYISTGFEPSMSSTAEAFLSLFGEKAPLPLFPLGKGDSTENKPNANEPIINFKSGAVDWFTLSVNFSLLGTLLKARIEHNNAGTDPSWFVEKFTLQSLARPREPTYHFHVNRWLSVTEDDGDVVRECSAVYFDNPISVELDYEILIGLGPKSSPDIPPEINVFVVLCGNSPLNSGKRVLRKPIKGSSFLSPSSESIFHISAVGFGPVTSFVIGHNAPDGAFQLDISYISVTWSGAISGHEDYKVDRLLVKTQPNQDAEFILKN